MGTITKRIAKDGKPRYRAQVRVQRAGQPPFTQSRTFSKEALARDWIKKLEAEIEINPAMLDPANAPKYQTLSDFIKKYLAEIEGEFAGTKRTAMLAIARHPLGQKNVYTLTRQDFAGFAIERRRGDIDTMTAGAGPSTVLKDLSHLSSVLNHAELVWGAEVAKIQLELNYAMAGLKKSRIITRSKERDRLITSDELQALTSHFYKSWRRVRNAVPMHLIIWLAIYTGRREGELCEMRLSDYDQGNSQWLIRDVKNPDGSKGNHKYAHLEPQALDVIHLLLEPETRSRMLELGYDSALLLPANPQTISDYFRRGCKMCSIDDLRFHDLRHEAATRYAEDGMTIPQLQTITLHSSWNSLKRYVNLKKRGKRLEFAEALTTAQQEYEKFYKDFSQKQRYISRNDAAAGLALAKPTIRADSATAETLADQVARIRDKHRQAGKLIKLRLSGNVVIWADPDATPVQGNQVAIRTPAGAIIIADYIGQDDDIIVGVVIPKD